MHRSEARDQSHPCGIAPNQNGAAGHQITISARRNNHALIPRGRLLNHPFKLLELKRGIPQGMGQIKDRVICILAMDTAQGKNRFLVDLLEHHFA